ncbi:MAG: rhodanese-like domain-containing protein [Syntrophobacteraceae bacterium]|jgi:predicted sulfurtransferase|nr:rhodanese-like domain-containing protein [Syntrophobacteraceae bacterium]
MRKLKMPVAALVILGLVVMAPSFGAVVAAKEIPRISIDDLKGMLDSKDMILIDVRSGKDWSSSELKIKGAVREDPKAFDSWAGKYAKDKKIILYCA